MAKKKVNVEEVSVVSDEKITHLSETDMRYIEGMHSQETSLADQVKIESLVLAKLATELKLLSANYTLKNKELEEQKTILESKQRELLAIKESNKVRLKSFKDKKGLEENWGYNPLTGEIK